VIAADHKLSPRTFRALFLLSALMVSALVWGIYWTSIRAVERAATQNLAERLSADAVMLEDHFTRSIDVVASVLRASTTLENPTRLSEPATGADALTRLIIEVPIIRSISLVDTDGRVVASSSARNVGMTLTAADLPTLAIPLQSDEVKFGEAFPLRDLYELNSDRTPVDIGFWTAQRSVQIEGRDYRWLIAINLGVFLNLWSEVDTDEATMILLVDENGRRIIDHHLKEKAFAERAIALVIERLSQAQHGSIDSTDQRLQIAFQGSAAYPAAIIMIGDSALLPVMAENLRNIPLAIAAASNVLLLSFIVLLFVFYLRYEKRSQELANQSRAIDMHLMVADLDREGRVLSGNKAFFEFNGYEPAELIGQPYTVLSTGQRAPEVRDAVWDLLRAGKPWKGTLRNRKKSGENYWVNTSIVPFLDVWGFPDRLVTLMTDITESVALSEAIEREKSCVTNSPAPTPHSRAMQTPTP
jgi:PAS domain S-box-containing protein